MPNSDLAMGVKLEAFLVVEESHFLGADSHRLRRHSVQIIFGQTLPARLLGNVEAGNVDETLRLDPDPLPPIQLHSSPEEPGVPMAFPCAFMQRHSAGVHAQDAQATFAVQNGMTGRGLKNPRRRRIFRQTPKGAVLHA